MKRKDLTQHLLKRTLDDLERDINLKVESLMTFSGVISKPVAFSSVSFSPVTAIWNYASTDTSIINKLNSLEDTGYCPSEDLQDIYQTLFGPILRLQQEASIPVWFWDTPLGFACKVSQARCQLDSFFPLSVMDIALLADRKHTTVQQHCQRGSIRAIKDNRSWMVPPTEALRYIRSAKSEPFSSNYNQEKYESLLKEWLASGIGSHINSDEIEKYYQVL